MATLQQWREFFATAPNKSTVFDVLDQAITVAASDFPDEFSRQKTRILESIQGAHLGCGAKSETGSAPVESPAKTGLKIRIKIPERCKVPAKDREKSAEPPCVVEAVKPISKAKLCLSEEAIEAKLQGTKRKMHDRYEEIENNKRQKRIQVLNYVPKQEFKVAIPDSSQKKAAGNHCRKRVGANKGFHSQSLLGRLVSC